MKDYGIRTIDELGRVVLPIELRKQLCLSEKDAVKIFMEGNQIILEKKCPTCIFCDSSQKLINYKNKTICEDCINELT